VKETPKAEVRQGRRRQSVGAEMRSQTASDALRQQGQWLMTIQSFRPLWLNWGVCWPCELCEAKPVAKFLNEPLAPDGASLVPSARHCPLARPKRETTDDTDSTDWR